MLEGVLKISSFLYVADSLRLPFFAFGLFFRDFCYVGFFCLFFVGGGFFVGFCFWVFLGCVFFN